MQETAFQLDRPVTDAATLDSGGRLRPYADKLVTFSAAQLRGHLRRGTFVAVVALGLAGLVLWLVGDEAGYAPVARLVHHADPRWLGLCLGAQIFAYAGYSLAYRETARFDGGPRFGLRRAVSR